MNAAPNERTPGKVGTKCRALREDDATIVADAGLLDKGELTLIAVAAIAGFELRKLVCGRWLVTRWNLQRELPDAGAVRAFLASAGVRA